MNLHGEAAGLDKPVFNVLGVQAASGNIVPEFFDENDFFVLSLDENGSISSNVGDYVNNATIRNKLTAANVTFKNCGDDDEATVVSSLLAQMRNEKLEIVNV